jgi:eukaryotic-like serine/threonine-protein kinase
MQLDRYVLYDAIAVGGMATVYFARQRGAAGFRKAVAIKRMRPDLAQEKEFVDLFVDEARLASRVRHANVVGVIDVVVSGEEVLLVMDYLHGESLARLLAASARAKEPVPVDIAVAIAVDMLHGLHAAHEAKSENGQPLGIVHRDVSPQNVLVGVDGVARVADFGVARAAGQLHRTDDGKTRGKAAYSAPEQLRRGEVDRTVDVFAASAVLWEMLVGRRLFEGESQAAIVSAVLGEPIDPPGLHRPEVPEEVDEVVLRGLDRDPKRRPHTALALAVALERAVTPAGPAVVSDWVTSLARDDLERREAVMRRIESGVDETPSILPPPARPSRRRWPIALALFAIAAIAATSGAVAMKSRPDAGRSVPSSTSAMSEPSPSPSPSPSPVTVASIADPPTLASSSPPPSSSLAPTSVPGARPKPRASTTTSANARRCDPPYDLDPAGRKIFRVECL